MMSKLNISFIFILALCINTNSALSQTCDQLADSLFQIETKLKSTRLPACTTDSNNCCSPDIIGSCKTISEAEQDYNKALAEVNIHESLIAISQAVENDHRALKDISSEELESTEQNLSNYMESLNKADIINSALIVDKSGSEAKTLWHDYKGSNEQELETHLSEKCKNKNFSEFCNKIMKKNKDDKVVFDTTHLPLLQNFAKANQAANPGLVDIHDVVSNYETKYKNYLKVKVNGKEAQAVSTLLDENSLKPYKELKGLIAKYKVQKDKNIGSQILKLANNLSEVTVDFDSSALSKATSLKAQFKSFVDDKIRKDLVNVNSVSSLLTNGDVVKENIKKTKALISSELKGQFSLLKRNFAKKFENYSNSDKTNPFKKLCPSIKDEMELQSCFKSICGDNYAETCSPTDSEIKKAYNQIGAESSRKDFLRYADGLKTQRLHDTILECMKDPSAVKRQECISQNKEKLSALGTPNLAKANEKLALAKSILNKLSDTNSLKELKDLKYISIASLEQKKCIGSSDYKTTSPTRSYCNNSNLSDHTSSLVDLSSYIDDVSLNLDLDLKRKEYSSLFNNSASLNGHQAEALRICKKLKDGPHSGMLDACKYLQQDRTGKNQKRKTIAIQQAKLKAKKEREARSAERLKLSTYDGPSHKSGASYAVEGLAFGVAKNMGSFTQYLSSRRSFKQQTNYYDRVYDYRTRMYDANTVHYQNYYRWNTNYNPYQFNSNTLGYVDTSSLSYNYTPIPTSFTTNNYLTPTTAPTTGPSPASTTVNFGF